MKDLMRWKEPRAALKAESALFKFKPNVFHFFLGAWLLWILYSGFRTHFAAWHFGVSSIFSWSFLPLYWFLLAKSGAFTSFDIAMRRRGTRALTEEGVAVSAFTFIPWHQIDSYSIQDHFTGAPIREVQILEKRKKCEWYELDLKILGEYHFTFDADEVDEAQLRDIFAQFAGAERESTEAIVDWLWLARM